MELVAYSFEMRFADDFEPTFIRFDLNPPNHLNTERGLRAHIHAGTDDYSVPSPVLDPLEILDLFLFGLIPHNVQKRRG